MARRILAAVQTPGEAADEYALRLTRKGPWRVEYWRLARPQQLRPLGRLAMLSATRRPSSRVSWCAAIHRSGSSSK